MSEQEIFKVALERDAEQRGEYLDKACGANAELRQRIEHLLKFHEGAGDFFEKPAVEIVATLDQRITEKPGTQIGPYKLLQQIGEGGFGVVYMVEQTEPVRRQVALKIIKPGMDTKDVIARFEAERQALALMDHPNIARVFDAGTTESGRPYFVMELVKGVPLVEFCDENNLDAKERLELFSVICRAVQHAHHRGVIHRDLKPSNILVTLHDNRPVPKVIDFGVSKAISQRLTEKTMFTAFGQMVGTPVYMSPEQAQMSGFDVDTRSDVYSLGVVLYELLTGSTPITAEELRRSGYAEIQRLIREHEPPKPSLRLSTTAGEARARIAKVRRTDVRQLGALLSGDLDWIVMKALEKDRNRRYDSANDFAEDVERFLGNEAVDARPPSFSYRLRKTVARNKAAFTTAALVLIALLVGIVTTSWQAWVATSERERAASALVEVSRERSKAVQEAANAKQARKLAEAETRRADTLRHISDVARYATRIRLADPVYSRVGDSEALTILDELDPKLRGWEHARLKAIWDARRHSFPADAHFSAVAITPDGKLVAAGGRRGSVRLFDFETNRIIEDLEISAGEVATLRFSRDGRRLLVGTYEALTLWDTRTLERIGRIPLPEQTRRPLREVFREELAKSSQAETQLNGERQVPPIFRHLPQQRPFVAFDAAGEKVAVATAEGIQIWDGQLGQMVCETPIGADADKEVYLVGLDFYPDGERLAVKQRVYVPETDKAPNDEYFMVDAATGERRTTSGELDRYGMMHYDGSLQVHPSGRWLITDEMSFITRALTMLDAETFQQAHQLMTGESFVDLFKLCGDGHSFAVSSGSNVSVRDFGSGGLISTLSPPFPTAGGLGNVIDMAISDDGKRVVACFGRPARAELKFLAGKDYHEGVVGWDLGEAPAVQSFAHTLPPGLERNDAPGVKVIIAPGGVDWFAHQIQSTLDRPMAVVHDTEEANNGGPPATPPPATSWVIFRSCRDGRSLFKLAETLDAGLMIPSISRDGSVMGIRHGGSLQLWDVAGRRRLPDPAHGYERIDDVLVDPTGQRVLIQGRLDGATEQMIWNLDSGQPVEATRIRFASDEERTRLQARCLAFDESGQRMARYVAITAHVDGPVRDAPILESRLEIVDTSTGQILQSLDETNGHVNEAVFVDDGKSLCFLTRGAAGDGPGTWYWDSTVDHSIRVHDRGGYGLQVSHDGRRLLLTETDPDQLFKSTLTLLDAETRQVLYQHELDQMSELVMTGTGDVLQFPILQPGRRLMKSMPDDDSVK